MVSSFCLFYLPIGGLPDQFGNLYGAERRYCCNDKTDRWDGCRALVLWSCDNHHPVSSWRRAKKNVKSKKSARIFHPRVRRSFLTMQLFDIFALSAAGAGEFGWGLGFA
jgi:hypothetical protein